MNKYIVVEKGTRYSEYAYRKIAVVLVDDDILQGTQPSMISERAIGVISIHKEFPKSVKGKTIKSKYVQYIKAANELAYLLNKELPCNS
jgi:hypothetical protein